LGDGETDEPESLGALSVAAREGLDNLVFVVNCNLQRLDGPVRGNGKIIQELEAVFRGAGWHVIKVIWGPEWDELLAKDVDGLLVQRMNETVDGQFQKYSVSDGAFIRQDFFGTDPRLRQMVAHLPDDRLPKLRRGGHSIPKLHAAYHAAVRHKHAPVAILAKTVKGWTLGEGFEASNVTHQMKKLGLDQLRLFRDTLQLPIPDGQLDDAPYYHPGMDSPEVLYMLERREALGGFLPQRRTLPRALTSGGNARDGDNTEAVSGVADGSFVELMAGSGNRAGVGASTTGAFVRLLRNLMRDKDTGKRVVPIIPDEARTFGMDAFFREFGIYAALGQKYTPVDSELFLNYHESRAGQILEEGITEAGAMASFIAAGTANATSGVRTIPFYIFYSMFGLQRTGDQAWSFADARGRGFLLGATAGRTTLNGEGLQHQDGHSHLLATTIPNLRAYDPAFAYEVAVIVRDGLRRMLLEDEDVFYYLTLYNESYVMPALPEGAEEGILRGMYLLRAAEHGRHRAQLFGSGPLIAAALEAQRLLAEQYDVAADVWSVTSYQQLYRDARTAERSNRLCSEQEPQLPYVARALQGHEGPVIATSDWVQELPGLLGRFIPRRFLPLGTNGFGRSDTREALRRHFEVDTANVVAATLHGLAADGAVERSVVAKAMADLELDPSAPDPMLA
jgi:pyruvate dehydrogenase E1 component